MCVIFDARRTTSSYPSAATPKNTRTQKTHELKKQYFGQFLSREAMPTASFTNATQHKNQKSEWNLSPKQTEKKALF